MIKNQWYAILPSRKVKSPQITAVKRLGMDLALFRDATGTLGCVVDQCTHRGAALSLGKLKDNHLQCPFHGLEFSTDGSCKFIPANGKSSQIDISRYNVKSYPVHEEHGIIYLWNGETQDQTNALPFFDDHVDESFSYSEIADSWNSHYSRCIENQLDVIHLPFVHYNTIGRGNKTLVNGPKVERTATSIKTSANNESDIGQTPRPASECTINPTYLEFKFPNIWMNHITDKIKVIIYFAPVDEENTILYIRFYCKATPIRFINAFIAFTGKFANKKIERQDRRVVITQKPKASALRSKEKLLSGDSPIIAYRQIREELQNQAGS